MTQSDLRREEISETKVESEKQTETAKETPKETPEQVLKRHKIRTFYAGLPGQEKLVAYAQNGDQLEVNLLDPEEILITDCEKVRQNEASAVDSLAGQPLDAKAAIAHETIETSRFELNDSAKLTALFNKYENEILKVESSSINNPEIPKAAQPFIISPDITDELQKDLKDLEYSIQDIGTFGFKAEKGWTKLVFILANQQEKLDQAKR
jgi:hypothetical protein